MTVSLPRSLAAEMLGTLLLVGCIIGSGILADRFSTDDGVALLGNTLATGAMLTVLILALGPVSGAHFNPAVTLVMALRRELTAANALAYVGAQCIGGVLGAVLAHAMFDHPLLEFSTHVREGFGPMLSEGVATFALVFTILAVRRTRPDAVPWAAALVIVAGYWWTASTSFANPAVTLARSFTDTFAGIRPADAPGFIVAQMCGALAAWGAFAALFAVRAESADREGAA